MSKHHDHAQAARQAISKNVRETLHEAGYEVIQGHNVQAVFPIPNNGVAVTLDLNEQGMPVVYLPSHPDDWCLAVKIMSTIAECIPCLLHTGDRMLLCIGGRIMELHSDKHQVFETVVSNMGRNYVFHFNCTPGELTFRFHPYPSR